MTTTKIYTTNTFTVKNARHFRKELEEIMGGDKIDLQATETGFSLWVEHDFINENPLEHTLTNDVVDFFQKHLRPDQFLVITSLILNQEKRDQKIDLYLISPIAYKKLSLGDCAKEIKRKLYPKFVHSNVLVKHYKTKLWLEKEKKYKALKEERTRLRSYLVIEHQDGRKVRWPKEYFHEGEQ
jgi:mRNA-degrading endonuclease YafQ of YafQ-DinJ toxin-antitoxin module